MVRQDGPGLARELQGARTGDARGPRWSGTNKE